MKTKILLVPIVASGLLSSCAKNSTTLPSVCATTTSSSTLSISANEFSPPSGVGSGTYTSDGPGPRRILLATSPDGINFTRSGKVLSDQANTPNMIVLPSGEIRIYYTGYNLDPSASSSDEYNKDAMAVAVSTDSASTWRYYCVGVSGIRTSHPPLGDPDVVRLSDGTYRLFYTNGTTGNEIHIFSATGSDGLSFAQEGTALDTGSQLYKDSLTINTGSQWVMYVLRSDNGQMLRATSADGKTFTKGADNNFTITVNTLAESFVLSNWLLQTNGQFRLFAFSGLTKDIRSFTSADGLTLTEDSTISLGAPLSSDEKSWVKDAAVQKLPDGTYLMAYVAEIP